MREEFHVVGPGITVKNLVEEHITKEFQQAYAVVLGDALQGVVSLSDVRAVPRAEWGNKYVAEVMTRASEVLTIQPDVPLEVALQHLVSGDLNQLVVVEGGKPIGLLTRGDVLRVVQISELFPR
jgi:CBS domain-containing protein